MTEPQEISIEEDTPSSGSHWLMVFIVIVVLVLGLGFAYVQLNNVMQENIDDLKQQLSQQQSELQAQQAVIAKLQARKLVTQTKQLPINAPLYRKVTHAFDEILNLPLVGTQNKVDHVIVTGQKDEDLDWHDYLQQSLAEIKSLVVVRRNDEQVVAAVSAEQQAFYYQYLQQCLAQAHWAVVFRHQDIFDESIASALVWTRQYFVRSDDRTKQFIDELLTLQLENVVAR